MPLEIIEGLPAATEYVALRVAAGLSPKSVEAAERGLPNTLYGLIVVDGEKIVGMGRVVGDGGCDFIVVDIAVLPAYQGQGLGKAVMLRLMTWLKGAAVKGSFISLIGDEPLFYEKLGFTSLYPRSQGMKIRWEDLPDAP